MLIVVHFRNYVESVSVEICTIMTRLGYGEEIRRWRVEKYRELDRLQDLPITAGSKAEGLTCRFESDYDILYPLRNVLSVETGINLHTIPGHIDVFRMDTRVYPGHCRLLQERPAHERLVIIENSLSDNGYGDVLLSSSLFVDFLAGLFDLGTSALELLSPRLVRHERAGPSIPSTVDGIPMDMVFSIRCHCPSILNRWATRPRHWPSPVVVKKVVSLGAYVTPVGCKGSENKNSEWRMCFNTGETELVNNLSDTQVKVYVLLKMILKHVLMPCKKEITSYVMKNIVLWQAESNPQNRFNARSLFHWLHDGLRELRSAIANKNLSYFMIPERNLMEGSGLDDKQQSKWVADITDMMVEGPKVLLRLPKIRQAVVASPEPMLWFMTIRMEVEMLWVMYMIRCEKCKDENGVVDYSNARLQQILFRLSEILTEVIFPMFVEGCPLDKLNLWDMLRAILG
ncbi:hypothetical protein DPMN_087690 [Dreissena polymorpha]|uniref:Mab-21-like HhH/H2TH-like domain-containing protein n=1 Tax=Dreissena polymorpha TaxID=45954 RepID=A0A9D4KT80_DREPO|nr:hypothetical protein DPMN_087690 [Dreissena polymorpha]